MSISVSAGPCPCVYAVRLVKLVRERHPVAAVLQREPTAGEEPVAEPAEAGPRVRQLGGGILDGSLGRVVVVRPPHAPAAPDQHVVLRVLQAGGGARLGVRAADVRAELRPGAVEERLAVALVRRDDVDEAADRVRPVEQGRRSAHDLDPLGAVRVDRHAVIARLAGQVARAEPVLEDEHPVAVEAADDGAARTGAEAAARDARARSGARRRGCRPTPW